MTEHARRHAHFEVEPVDLAEVALPLLDEPEHPRLRRYVHEHTKRWSAIVERADAFVVVLPEYDHGPPASFLNAVQYLVHEWRYKPMGIVSYGGVSGGTRSMTAILPTLVGLEIVPVASRVSIPFFSKHFDAQTGTFAPGDVQDQAAKAMLDDLVGWTDALRPLRARVQS